MDIEQCSHQVVGSIAEVQMEPDRGMPRTTQKNLRVLRALRGVTPEMIFFSTTKGTKSTKYEY